MKSNYHSGGNYYSERHGTSRYHNGYSKNNSNNIKYYNSNNTYNNYDSRNHDEYLVSDCDYYLPNQLKEFCYLDPIFKVVEIACPIDSNLMLVDISMNPKGIDEEKLYIRNPEYIKNIRRGNTLLEFYDYLPYKNEYKLKNTIMLRKGMMKFIDLPYQIIDLNDNNYLKKDNLDEIKFQARKLIMGPVLYSLSKGKSIEVFKLIKANGENAQISFESGMWAISSKNVCLLAKNRHDLEFYLPINKQGENSRWSFAYVIGQCWFDYLEKLEKNKLYELKQFMTGRTFIGEYVGNQNHQHLIRYTKHTILFYAIVENDSEENSIPVPEAYKNFKNFHMDVVPYEHIGVFSDHKSLCRSLSELYIRIAQSSIIYEEEGSVVYISEKYENNSKILVLCKLKTLEYRVYRKLREKLKNHLLEFNDDENTKLLESRKKINQFFEEVRDMLKGYYLPLPMSFYYKVAETAFAFVNKFNDKCNHLHSFYIDFLEIVHSIIDQTVDLKSRSLRSDNVMTYDSLINKNIISRKRIEIYIYAPPLYLSDEFMKSIEMKFNTTIKNFYSDSIVENHDILIYHINMHNFRIFNKLEENKFIFIIGIDESGCNKSKDKLNIRMKNPHFISYNTNSSLVSFLLLDDSDRESTINNYLNNSKLFIENSKNFISAKMKVISDIDFNEEYLIKEIDFVVGNIRDKLKNLDEEKIKNELFLFEDISILKHNQKKTIPCNKFISLYESHQNRFSHLKESFIKELEVSKQMKNQINITQPIIEIKKTVVILIPMTIPGTGKTYFVDQLKEIINQFNIKKIGFESISSDEIRRKIMNDIIYKKGVSEDKAFSMSGKSASFEFERQIKEKFLSLVNDNNLSLLYLDKNHPPNALTKVFESIRQEIHKIKDSSQYNIIYTALLPECFHPMKIGINKTLPFSLSYFLQCYVRIRNRYNHPTLNGDKQDLICILGMFINNFINLLLDEQTLMLHYHFNKLIKLPFTQDISENNLPSDLVQAAYNFFNNLPRSNEMPELNEKALFFEKLINKYFPSTNKFLNTKDLVKDTARPFLKALYGLTEESVNIPLVNQELKPTKLKDLFVDDNKKNGLKEEIKIIPPNNFIYLGLLVSKSANIIYKQILLYAMEGFIAKENKLDEASIILSSIKNNVLPKNWKTPHDTPNIWHVTTYFKGKNNINFSHPAYSEFVQNKLINVNINGLVYVPGKIIFCIVKTNAYIENEFPHMTTLISEYPPKMSNEIMKKLFSKGSKYHKDYNFIIDDEGEYLNKLSLEIDGHYMDCFIIKFPKPIILESIMNAFEPSFKK